MKKGLIIEIDDLFLTLLTPEGEFLRSRKQNEQHQLGEEIYFFPIEPHVTPRWLQFNGIFKLKSIWTISVLAILLIILSTILPMNQDNKAYAYMTIDVNPSIELAVNKKMQVVELTGFNKEGKKVVSFIRDWKKKDVKQVTQSIFTEIEKEGYFKNKAPVILSTVHIEKVEEKVEGKLEQNIKEIKKTVTDNKKLNLTVYNGTEKEREKAHNLGITTGKYYENKVEASMNKKKEEKLKHNENNTNLSKPYKPSMPPGQLRKQPENQASPEENKSNPNRGNTSNNHNSQKQMNNGSEKKIPPGQLKKMDEEEYKRKYGQEKKQENKNKEKSNWKHNSHKEEKKYKK